MNAEFLIIYYTVIKDKKCTCTVFKLGQTISKTNPYVFLYMNNKLNNSTCTSHVVTAQFNSIQFNSVY